MSKITLQDILDEAKITEEILKVPCPEESLPDLADFCEPWYIVGPRLKLTQAEIDGIDEDCKTSEEKRLKVLQKWKEAYSFKATFGVFVNALIDCRKAEKVLGVCRYLKSKQLGPRQAKV